MRLWHQALLPYLDNQRLLGEHRECCALRGNGWGKKHATVDYVFTHDYTLLYRYHWEVMCEMVRRGYKIDPLWLNSNYRGKHRPPLGDCSKSPAAMLLSTWAEMMEPPKAEIIYPEHDQKYLYECVWLLQEKKAPVDFAVIAEKFFKER